MTPIPPEAAPVVAAIRRDVPRPKPEEFYGEPILGGKHMRIRVWRGPSCPMGLLPFATDPIPTLHDLQPVPDDISECSMVAFSCWWDSQTEAAAAVAAVWGPE